MTNVQTLFKTSPIKKYCSCCRRKFTPRTRQQRHCSTKKCQSKRKRLNRRAWRKKPENQKFIRAQQRRWQKNHPGYMKSWREEHPKSVKRNRKQTNVRMRRKRRRDLFEKRAQLVESMAKRLCLPSNSIWSGCRRGGCPRWPALFKRGGFMQDKDAINQRILHLWDVEKLSKRQIAVQLEVDRGRVRRVIDQSGQPAVPAIRKNNLDQYRSLIAQWYEQYPRLRAIQVYERLKNYGYTGRYDSVKIGTREYRQPSKQAFHPLIFNPGQEAQVDWFHFKHETIGAVAGFLYVLAYSRYAWGMFYPRTTFEFFLAGHVECFKHLGGLARTGRYDNLKSAVLRRKPQIEYNPQFMDFARFYGFSVHACNPYSGNEKGRVERIIRDARVFLETETFIDLADLNRKFQMWLEKRNNTVHRSTERTPKDLLSQEHLLKPPANAYSAKRIIPTRVTKTALVEFDDNKYSVPSSCVGKMADIAAYPGHIEVWLESQKIATHKRCFGRRQIIQNPLHAERLLNRSPQFRQKRIQESIIAMDPAFKVFVERQEDEETQQLVAYQIYQLMRNHSRSMVLSAVRELNGMNCAKIKALTSLLHVPCAQEPPAVWPKDQRLLNLNYEERKLTDYDPNTKPVQDA